MKLENQVCSFKQAKKLKELGVFQDSLFYFSNGNWLIKPKPSKFNGSETSTFTVAELSVMLGDNYPSWSFEKDERKWITTIIDKNEKRNGKNITTAPEFDRFATTQAQSMAELLIAVIEINWVKIIDVNDRLLNS